MESSNRTSQPARTLSTLAVMGALAALAAGSACGPAAPSSATPALSAITVGGAGDAVPKGLSQQLVAMGTYSDGSTKDISGAVTWASADAGIAAVSGAGLAKAVGTGHVVITAAADGRTGSATLLIGDAALVSLALVSTDISVAKGLSQRMVAMGTYTDGTTKDVTAAARWASSDPAVASVSNDAGEGGQLTTYAQGSTQVSAWLGNLFASARLVVTAPVLVSLGVTASQTSLSVGASGQILAMAKYSDGTTVDVSDQVLWSSSDSNVVRVTDDAVAQAVSIGTAMITATLGGMTGSMPLAVM